MKLSNNLIVSAKAVPNFFGTNFDVVFIHAMRNEIFYYHRCNKERTT